MIDIDFYRLDKLGTRLKVPELEAAKDYLNNPNRKLIPSLILYRVIYLNCKVPFFSALSTLKADVIRDFESETLPNKNHLSVAYLYARSDYPQYVKAFWDSVPPWYKEAFYRTYTIDPDHFIKVHQQDEFAIRARFHYVEAIDLLFTGDQMFKDPVTYKRHKHNLDILKDVLNGSFRGILHVPSIYPFGNEPILVEGLSLLTGPYHIRVDLKDGTAKALRVKEVASQSHHLRLTAESGDFINLTLDKDHPLYKTLTEEP